MKIPLLYHGTCLENAKSLMKNGFDPSNPWDPSANCGRPGLLYVTDVPDNALWFAENIGCHTVVEIRGISEKDLIVDPDDGRSESDKVEDELAYAKMHHMPAYLAIRSRVTPEKFSIYNGKLQYSEEMEEGECDDDEM